jgi:hypothetical protein
MKERRLILDPSANASKQLSDEPNLTIPYVERDDPSRKNERKLILDPSANVSKQLSEDPRRTIP